MLRIATVNVNGIRAAWRKGMKEWLEGRDADIVTLQEVRCPDDLVHELLEGTGYHVVHTEAAAKGRSGVAVLSRLEPVSHRVGNGDAFFDDSGRWIESDLALPDGSVLTVVSVYVHSGGVGTPSQEEKYRFLDQMTKRMAELGGMDGYALITGDLNVGHTELDIRNWKGNVKKAGFLPQERAYFDQFFGDLGWYDVHRRLAGPVDGPYTWWSMRGQAFDNDTGWRIDYQIATPELAAAARVATVDRAPSWGERWSDHAPLTIDYDLA
ncbi:exodeoxyribonuclease III [Aeromicrobium flavum]|uniref:Exodeoxyribonuclease III n=1 Tax=Aeromicrobium flavum TaxID=416568 RepID=A0A512HQY2_9ACTN|nr:exodeoxyribonuclease III [Aeromicrobium flavum]GEO87862.1 exodeoxyribonuclease III [Aeromicrobium flavum]